MMNSISKEYIGRSSAYCDSLGESPDVSVNAGFISDMSDMITVSETYCADESVHRLTAVRSMISDSIGSSPDVSVHDPDDNEAYIKEIEEDHSYEESEDILLEDTLLDNTLQEDTLLEDTLQEDTILEDTVQGASLFQDNVFKTDHDKSNDGDVLCDLTSRKRPWNIDDGFTPKCRRVYQLDSNVHDKDALSPVSTADTSAGAKRLRPEPCYDTPQIFSKFQLPSNNFDFSKSSTPISNKDCHNSKHIARKSIWNSSASSSTDAEFEQFSTVTQEKELDQMTCDELIAEISSILDEGNYKSSVNEVSIESIWSDNDDDVTILDANKVNIEPISDKDDDVTILEANKVNIEPILSDKDDDVTILDANKDNIEPILSDKDDDVTILEANTTVVPETGASEQQSEHISVEKASDNVESSIDISVVEKPVRSGRFKDVVATISMTDIKDDSDNFEITDHDFLGLESYDDDFETLDEISLSVIKDEEPNSLITEVRNKWQSDEIASQEINLTVATTFRKKRSQRGETVVGVLENDKFCCLNLYESEVVSQQACEALNEDYCADPIEHTLARLYQQKECLGHMKRTGICKLREGLTARTDHMLERHKDEMNHLMMRQTRNKAGDRVSKQLIKRLTTHHGREYSELRALLDRFIQQEIDRQSEKLEPVDLLIKQLEEHMCRSQANSSGACGTDSVNMAGDSSSVGVGDGRYGPAVMVTLKMGPTRENRGCSSGVAMCLPAVIAQMVSQEDDIYNHFYRY